MRQFMRRFSARARAPVCMLVCALVCGVLPAGAAAIEAGDPERGRAKAAPCAACHGADGNSVNPAWPKIAGQSREYIYKQLDLFKRSQRVNPLMNPQTAALSEEDMRDLAAHFAAQQTKPGAADPQLVELGERLYRGGNAESDVPACLSCHGPKGSGNPAAGFPKLSYQHAQYVAARLAAYRAGGETYPGADIMTGIAAPMTDREIEAVAAYIQGLH